MTIARHLRRAATALAILPCSLAAQAPSPGGATSAAAAPNGSPNGSPNAAPGSRRLPAGAQPRVIVIPFVKEGQDIRTVLDNDFDRRVAIAKVQEAFDRRGFSTVDFFGALQQAMQSGAGAAEAESDFRTRLFEMNRADIYVVTDHNVSRMGGTVSVMMRLAAHLTANGMSLGAKTPTSPRIREPIETERLIARAVEIGIDSLLDVMQGKMGEFWEEGVPVNLELRVAQGATLNFESVPAGQTEALGDLIREFVEKTSFRNAPTLSNETKNLLGFTDVRLPMRDPQNRPPSPSRYAQELVRFLRTVGVRNASRNITNGAIYVDVK